MRSARIGHLAQGAPPAPVVSFDVLVDQETLVETQHTYPTAAFRNSEIQRRAKDDRLGQRSVQMLRKSQFERLAGKCRHICAQSPRHRMSMRVNRKDRRALLSYFLLVRVVQFVIQRHRTRVPPRDNYQLRHCEDRYPDRT
jgi:hypothetical protein